MKKNTMLIQLTNQKAVGLLHELEALRLIKVLKEDIEPKGDDQAVRNISKKYRGMLTKEQGQQLEGHIQEMRSEWSDT